MSDERTAAFRRLYAEARIADQRDFYNDRQKAYESANRRSMLWRNLLLVAAAVAGVVGTSISSEAGRTGLGLGAAICAALAAILTAWETLMGFGPNAKLYEDARINLDENGLDEGSDLAEQVRAVETVLRRENSRWGQLTLKSHEPDDRA
jgi:conflict system pore-forming effector with SLATT domain